MKEDPTEIMDSVSSRTNISIRNLGMKGKAENNLAYLEKLANDKSAIYGKMEAGGLLKRL